MNEELKVIVEVNPSQTMSEFAAGYGMLVLWLAAVTCSCVYLHFRLRRRRLYALAGKIQGLDGLPFIGNAHQFAGSTENIMNRVKQVADESMKCQENKYLYKVWLGPRLQFSIGDPRDAEVILKNYLEKEDLVKFMWALSGFGLIFAPVSIWKNRRKIVMPAFSRKILDTFVGVFYEQSEILVDVLKQHVGQGPVRMCRLLNAYSLDAVSETAMGIQMKSQKSLQAPYMEAVENVFNVICTRIFHIWLHPDAIFKWTSLRDEQQKSIETIHRFVDAVIHKKRQQLRDQPETLEKKEEDEELLPRKPFLDLMISLSGKEKAFTDVELREEVLTMIIAGTDTSALAVGYTLICLGAHPNVQQRAYDELIAVVGDGQITKEDLPRLHFLERVIKESMRMYPPVPLTIRKVDREIQLPSGPTLPAGSGAFINLFCLHRNPDHWGPNADQFDPDRFLKDDRHPCAYMPFSYGPRRCLGYQYAMMSMKTVVANILKNYKMKSKMVTNLKIEIMLRPTEGINIAFEKRNKTE